MELPPLPSFLFKAIFIFLSCTGSNSYQSHGESLSELHLISPLFKIFNTVPLRAVDWLYIFIASSVILWIVEGIKLINSVRAIGKG